MYFTLSQVNTRWANVFAPASAISCTWNLSRANSVVSFTDVTVDHIKAEDSDRLSEEVSVLVIRAVEMDSRRLAVAEVVVVVVDSETGGAADPGPEEGTSKITHFF